MQFQNIHLTILSIILLVFSGLCFILTYLTGNPDLKNILINFGTDAVFLLFVIFLFDKLIEKNNNQKWAEFDRLVKNRLKLTTSKFIGSLSFIFDYGKLFDKEILKTGDSNKILKDGMDVLKTNILPNLPSKCKNLTIDERKTLLNMFEEIDKGINDIYRVFSSRITPKMFENLLKIQQLMENARPVLEEYGTPEIDQAMELAGTKQDEHICNVLNKIGLIFLELEED